MSVKPRNSATRRSSSGQLRSVAVEQVEHVLRGAHRALDAAQRVPVDQRTQPRQRKKHLLGRRRESLAQRGGLRGDVVAAAGHHQVAVADRPLGQPRHHRDAVRKNELKRPADLQLLNVFGEVAARHALVHMLVARERVELLDAGLDVVAQHPFPRGDRRQVDVVQNSLVVGENRGRNSWAFGAQLGLRPQHRQPQPAFGDDLGLR